MHLTHLQATNIRNLNPLQITPSNGCNIFWGQNGSGKTSILEAIHLLGLGRSFRTHLNSHILQHEKDFFTVFAKMGSSSGNTHTMGVEKNTRATLQIKIDGESLQSLAALAMLLPLQFINADSYQLLNDGPKLRRQFLDWGLFHVEQSFYQTWKRYQQALQQRNAALRNNLPKAQIILWDSELINTGKALHQYRHQFVLQFAPVFNKLIAALLPAFQFEMEYLSGWHHGKMSLETALKDNLDRDKALGYTQIGPHRADLQLKTNKLLAKDVLSRGQQKLVISALRLAQGLMLRQHTNKTCIYLIDDLPAELDARHRLLFGEVLYQLQAQVFITSVDPESVVDLVAKQETKMFHVEHGTVKQEKICK